MKMMNQCRGAWWSWLQWCAVVLTCCVDEDDAVDEDGGEEVGEVKLVLKKWDGSRRASCSNSCPERSCHVVDGALSG